MNEKLLEQLRLAKEAGTSAMAKDFFAKTPGASPAEGGAEPDGDEAAAMPPAGGDAAAGGGDLDGLTPEQLEELMRMLGDGAGGGGAQ